MMGNGDWMDGSNWIWMLAMMAFWVVALGLAVWAIVAFMRRDGSARRPQRTPLDKLDERLARGEVDVDEYQSRRDAMRPAAR